jgi:hypothetical protein
MAVGFHQAAGPAGNSPLRRASLCRAETLKHEVRYIVTDVSYYVIIRTLLDSAFRRP